MESCLQVAYLLKSSWFGKHFLQIDRFFPSSKICSFCRCQQEMPLNVRMYQCRNCGIQIDRDLNASLNIRAAGLAVINACGGLEVALSGEAGITGLKAGEGHFKS